MAEGFLKSFDKSVDLVSAGTEPSSEVNPKSIIVMAEKGLDISQNVPNSINDFLVNNFDYVITVCDGAKESCPAFTGDVKRRMHIGFDDPAEVTGSEEYILSEYRRIRDEIYQDFKVFYNDHLKSRS